MRLATSGIALTLILLTAVASGRWNGRWGASNDLQEAVNRLAAIPDRFGDWEGQEAAELDERAVAIGEIDGYLLRSYRNVRDGEQVTALLVCGRPGPISRHTPDVCYRGQGYIPADEPADRTLDLQPAANPASFETAVFHKERSAVPDSLVIYWSWDGAGRWEAPDNPRWEYASNQALYKLYVVRKMISNDESREAEVAEGFIRQFLPELQRALASRDEAS